MPVPPTPTVLKVMRGNPGRRPLNHNEPQPEALPAEVPMPEVLNADGREKWEQILPILEGMRVMTAADYGALTNMCIAYQVKTMALREMGDAVQAISKRGSKPKPAFRALMEAMAMEDRIGQQFGLTPASRSKIKVEPAPKESRWARLKRETQQENAG